MCFAGAGMVSLPIEDLEACAHMQTNIYNIGIKKRYIVQKLHGKAPKHRVSRSTVGRSSFQVGPELASGFRSSTSQSLPQLWALPPPDTTQNIARYEHPKLAEHHAANISIIDFNPYGVLRKLWPE